MPPARPATSRRPLKDATPAMPTYDRRTVFSIAPEFGEPFVYLGRDRYAVMSDMALHHGVQATIRALHDRHSMLAWPRLQDTLRAAMIMLWLLPGPDARPLDAFTPPLDGRTELAVIVADVLAHAVPGQPFHDAARRFADLSVQLSSERDPLLSPEVIGRLLGDLALTGAAMLVAEEGDATEAVIRESVHTLIGNPTVVAEQFAPLLIGLRVPA